MAKTIGNIDAETLQLSLGLVSKASRRIIAALRQVAGAVGDAAERGRQCSSHSTSIVSFATGRANAAEDDDEAARLALPPAPDSGTDATQREPGEQSPPPA